MTPEQFVSSLHNVKKRGRNQWLCSCPAHADDDPSLAVTTTANGKILLKCFAGCSALEVVDAMGLKLEDLFPDAYEENPMAFAKREMAAREKEKDKIEYARNYLAILTKKLSQGFLATDAEIEKAYKLKKLLQENAQSKLSEYREEGLI